METSINLPRRTHFMVRVIILTLIFLTIGISCNLSIVNADTIASQTEYADYIPVRSAYTTTAVKLRSDISKSSSTVYQVSKGTTIRLLGKYKMTGTDWYKVQYNGEICYVSSAYVKLNYTQYTVDRYGTAKSDIILRSSIGDNMPQRAEISAGDEVYIYGKISVVGTDWYKVKYNGQTGYVSMKNISLTYTDYIPDRSAITKQTVNLRSTISTKASVVYKVSKGSTIRLLGKYKTQGSDWYKVQYKGKTCYVSSAYVKLNYTDYDVDRYAIAKSDTVLRASMGDNMPKRSDILAGDAVLVYGKMELVGTDWYKVEYNGQTGYISTKDVSFEYEDYTPDRYAKTTTTVRLRSSVSKSASTVYKVSSGTTIRLLGEYNVDGSNWYKVLYNNKTCYVSSAYVKVNYTSYSPDKIGMTEQAIELKKQLNSSGEVKLTIPQGEVITIYGKYSVVGTDWYKVSYNGTTGFISSKYITEAAVYGIDVSEWNGTINWSKVKADGVKYAFIRVGGRYGESGNMYIDENFIENIEGAISAGIDVGVYYYTQAISTKEAILEAEYVIRMLEPYKNNVTMPIAYDTEYLANGRHNDLTVSTRTSVANVFCETIEAAGYDAMIYSNSTWLEDKLYMNKLTDYKTWVAQYWNANLYKDNETFDHNAGTTSNASYEYEYEFWQYTSSGTVNGISGRVDLNWWYPDGKNN